jgi:hypothetical protein
MFYIDGQKNKYSLEIMMDKKKIYEIILLKLLR